MARRRHSRPQPAPVEVSGPSPAGTPHSRLAAPRRHAVLAGLALVVLTLVVYVQTWRFDFVQMDDPLYVFENGHITAGLTWSGAVWALTSFHAGFWIPLTWLSFMAEVQLFGVNPGAMHLGNVVLHLANTLLLCWLLNRMTKRLWPSVVVAALFALHPLHVESVAWITERKDVLSTCLALCATGAYVAWVTRPRWTTYAAVLLLFVLSLMAKPMLVTLPVLLLLLDIWPLDRLPRAPWPRRVSTLVREKLPLFAIAGAFGVLTVVSQHQGETPLDALPLPARMATAVTGTAAYIGRMFWPVHLSPIYFLSPDVLRIPGTGPAPSPAATADAMWAVLAIAGITGMALSWRRQRPYVLMGWLWYLIALLPVSGFLQSGPQSMADRFTYVPLIGLWIAVVWVAADLCHGRVARMAAVAAASLAIGACVFVSFGQVQVWRDSVAYSTRATEVTLGLDEFTAHIVAGEMMDRDGRLGEAMAHYTDAVRLQPASAQARQHLARTLVVSGRADEALPHLREALRLDPGLTAAHRTLGALLVSQQRYDEALPHLREAARRQPDDEGAQVDLGIALTFTHQTQEAVAAFDRVLRLNPENAVARRAKAELAGLAPSLRR